MAIKRKGGSIVFTNGKKMLLMRRSKNSSSSGKWDIPGGRADAGEKASEAAVREAREECGKIEGKLFYEIVLENKHVQWSVLFYKVPTTFACRLSDEHDDYKWVKFDDIKDYKLHHKLREYINKYQKAIRENIAA